MIFLENFCDAWRSKAGWVLPTATMSTSSGFVSEMLKTLSMDNPGKPPACFILHMRSSCIAAKTCPSRIKVAPESNGESWIPSTVTILIPSSQIVNSYGNKCRARILWNRLRFENCPLNVTLNANLGFALPCPYHFAYSYCMDAQTFSNFLSRPAPISWVTTKIRRRLQPIPEFVAFLNIPYAEDHAVLRFLSSLKFITWPYTTLFSSSNEKCYCKDRPYYRNDYAYSPHWKGFCFCFFHLCRENRYCF